MIGVDYDTFWTLNQKSLQPFIKAFSLKKKDENEGYWLQGLYIQHAIASCFNKDSKYPKKPFSQSDDSQQESIKERFMRDMNIINSRFRKEE